MADKSFISDNYINCREINETFDDDQSKIRKFCFLLNSIPTDVLFCDYIDKQMLVITQYQKLGTFVLVSKGHANNLNELDSVYDVKTISGLDSEDYHLAARYLAEQLNIFKPVLFSISLQENSLQTLKSIVKILRDNNIF